MSQDPNEAATERELAEDSLSRVTYESDPEMKQKKKTTLKAPKSPKSPYLSSTRHHSKGLLRSFSGTESKHFEIPLIKTSRQLWRGSYHQGTWLAPAKSDLDPPPSLPGRTPEYLKEALGMKKPKHARSSSSGYIPGTPDYKEKEEMYDEIIELKKTVQAQKCEADRMKTKLRRLEEENTRKDKQIEQLLDSSKCSEFGWARTEQKNDTSLTIRGLKQKILKLEQQCKEKDNAINKLQTDVKSTNAEEMRIALQSYFEEIQRLQAVLAKSKAVQQKPSAEKQQQQKVLSAAVLQLSRNIQRLQDENRKLKADLDHALASSPAFGKAKNYTEWSRQRLIRRIANLERKMEAIQNSRVQLSETSSSPSLTPLVSVQLDQLAAEEWDPHENCEHLCRAAKKLKEQRVVLQNQLAAKEEEIQNLAEKVRELERNQEPYCQPAGMATSAAPDQRSPGHLREDQAAEIIQRQWKAYRMKKPVFSLGPDDEAQEEAVVLIQSVFRAHQRRTQLEERPLISSPGSERASPAASEEEKKLLWSPFKYAPLVFTSTDPETSFQDRPDFSLAPPTQEVPSDDSDEIITVPPVKKTPSLDFTRHVCLSPSHA